MAIQEAGTQFVDGMRVAVEHMRHLQQTALDRARQLRRALGGGVCHGLRAQPAEGAAVRVSPGLAIDGLGRAVELAGDATVPVAEGRQWLVLVFELRSSLPVDGVPTLLANAAVLQARTQPPPYDDGAVPFAEALRSGSSIELLQRGEWYLPPLHHGHGGGFFTDAQGLWRYDGAPLGTGFSPHFDSGWVPLAPGAQLALPHGLQTRELLVDLSARRDGGAPGNRGIGRDWWYELPDDDTLLLQHATGDEAPPLELRARAWRTDTGGAALLRPVADAGPDREAEPGQAVVLDGTRSRALGDRHLVRYVWTLLG